MNVTRRPTTDTDTPFARRAHHGAYREAVTRQFGRWDETQQDEYFARDWADSEFEILELDGVPCGYACIEERDQDVHVREIVVHSDFQGRGVGTAVLRETQERARARGVPVVLGTFLTNRAVGLYRRLGFQETGRTDVHVLMEWRPDAAPVTTHNTPQDQRHREPLVLLIGGPSGVGKTTASAAMARRLGWPWLMVDDLRLALLRSVVAVPDFPEVRPFDAPGSLLDVAEVVAPAIEVVVENHVDQRLPVVIEGDGILPSLLERDSVRSRRAHVRIVYLHDSDPDALLANLVERGADGWRADLGAYAERSVAFGEWLRQEAERRGLPVLSARPHNTVVDRILAATGVAPATSG